SFGTSSDDGSVLLIDLDGNGTFSAAERIVNNNFFQGNTARTGNATFPGPGTYEIAIAYYQGGGGGAREGRFAKTGGGGGGASQTVIDPSAAGQAGMWSDDSSVGNRLTERWYNRAPLNVNNSSPELDPVALPTLTGNILPFATVTTFYGQPTEAVDLVRDVDPAAGGVGLGRPAPHRARNDKGTANRPRGAPSTALLACSANTTGTPPAGGA